MLTARIMHCLTVSLFSLQISSKNTAHVSQRSVGIMPIGLLRIIPSIESFNFPQVKTLSLPPGNDKVGEWFSKGSWPNLTTLDASEELKSNFLSKAPSLVVDDEDEDEDL